MKVLQPSSMVFRFRSAVPFFASVAVVGVGVGVFFFCSNLPRSEPPLTKRINSTDSTPSSALQKYPERTKSAAVATTAANIPLPAPPTTTETEFLRQQIAELLVHTLDGPDREAALSRLLANLLAVDPAAAAHIVAIQPAGPDRDELLRLLARAWTATDFPGAIQWAATLSDPAERRRGFEFVCFKAAETQPSDALDAWTSFQPAPDHAMFGNLVKEWAGRDVSGALAWANSRSTTEARDYALANVAFVVSQTDPYRAAEIISTQTTTSAPHVEATVALIRTWASHDYPAASASAWVATHLHGTLADRAQQELAAFKSQ